MVVIATLSVHTTGMKTQCIGIHPNKVTGLQREVFVTTDLLTYLCLQFANLWRQRLWPSFGFGFEASDAQTQLGIFCAKRFDFLLEFADRFLQCCELGLKLFSWKRTQVKLVILMLWVVSFLQLMLLYLVEVVSCNSEDIRTLYVIRMSNTTKYVTQRTGQLVG